jgi:copper chaperone
MTTETLHIDGMTCGHCAAAVRRALDGLDGVEVDYVQIGEARVHYDEATVNHDAIAAAVEEEGYTLQPA